jgi:ribosomal protein L19
MLPFFKKGSILSINLQYYQGPVSTQHNVQGVCIKKKNQGNYSYFSIKCLINNETLIQTFPLYSPFIKKIQVLSF